MWDLATNQPLGDPLTGHIGSVWAVTVGTLNGRPVAVTGGNDATVRVWDLASGQPLFTFTFPYAVFALALTPDGELVVGFGWEVAVLRWMGGQGA